MNVPAKSNPVPFEPDYLVPAQSPRARDSAALPPPAGQGEAVFNAEKPAAPPSAQWPLVVILLGLLLTLSWFGFLICLSLRIAGLL